MNDLWLWGTIGLVAYLLFKGGKSEWKAGNCETITPELKPYVEKAILATKQAAGLPTLHMEACVSIAPQDVEEGPPELSWDERTVVTVTAAGGTDFSLSLVELKTMSMPDLVALLKKGMAM